MSTNLRNKLLIIIFLLFVFVSSFGVCYSFVKIKMGGPIIIERGPTNVNNTEDDFKGQEEKPKEDVEVKKGPVVLKSTKAIGSLITQTYEFTLNGVSKTFTIEYTKTEQFDYTYIKGKSYDGIELVNLTLDSKGSNFTEDFINSVYGIKNMEVIRGTDGKEYLAIMTYASQMSTTNKIRYYIFNQDGKCINKDEEIIVAVLGQTLKIAEDENIWYKSSLVPSEVQARAKIEDNKIYVLKHIHDGDCLGKMEDRIYTIEDGALKYTAKKSFTVSETNGICYTK